MSYVHALLHTACGQFEFVVVAHRPAMACWPLTELRRTSEGWTRKAMQGGTDDTTSE